ncbi:MAG: peptidylprolyl isomerase [Acidimicrobiales bacterium]
MVNTDKRHRHKEGHRSRIEAARVEEAKRRRTRTVMVVVGTLAAVVAIFVAVTVTRNDDQEVQAGDRTTTTAGPTSVPGVSLPSPPDGQTLEGATPCPEGDVKRTVAFEQAPPVCIDPKETYRATVTTSKGPIVIALDPAQSPTAVNNFVVLARYHYYDGLPFHRIVSGFVDQTGSSGRPDYPSGGPGYSLPDEDPKVPYEKGTVAMAVGGEQVSGSQFFFTIDPTPLEGGGYPILGKVTEKSLAVVEEINSFGSETEGGEPTEVVTIEQVEISGP